MLPMLAHRLPPLARPPTTCNRPVLGTRLPALCDNEFPCYIPGPPPPPVLRQILLPVIIIRATPRAFNPSLHLCKMSRPLHVGYTSGWLHRGCSFRGEASSLREPQGGGGPLQVAPGRRRHHGVVPRGTATPAACLGAVCAARNFRWRCLASVVPPQQRFPGRPSVEHLNDSFKAVLLSLMTSRFLLSFNEDLPLDKTRLQADRDLFAAPRWPVVQITSGRRT